MKGPPLGVPLVVAGGAVLVLPRFGLDVWIEFAILAVAAVCVGWMLILAGGKENP